MIRVLAPQLLSCNSIGTPALLAVRIAVELSNAVRLTTIAGIRRRHPEYSQRETVLAFLRLVYGIGK